MRIVCGHITAANIQFFLISIFLKTTQRYFSRQHRLFFLKDNKDNKNNMFYRFDLRQILKDFCYRLPDLSFSPARFASRDLVDLVDLPLARGSVSVNLYSPASRNLVNLVNYSLRAICF